MDSTLGDFLRQVPLGLLAAPVFFGVIYAGLMVFIFRRAGQRRRRRADEKNGIFTPASENRQEDSPIRAVSNLMSGIVNQLSAKAEGPGALPEPELDQLVETGTPARSDPVPEPARAVTAYESILPPAPYTATVLPTITVEKSEVTTVVIPEKVDWPSMMPPGSSASNVTPTDATPTEVDHNDMVEVMRIWRDLGDGSLVIELGGRRYRSVNDISNGELLRRFTAVVRELWQMVNGSTANRTLANPPASSNASLNAGGASVANVPLPTGGTSSLFNRVGALNPPPEIDPDASKPRGILRGATRQTGTTPAAARRPSIGDAVEDYLQFKLSTTAQFQARSIHVRPAVDGGVRIEVDGHYYDGVGDVVDADVRDFLLATLREWEARQ